MVNPTDSEVTPKALEVARHAYYYLRDILDEYAEAYHEYLESGSAEADRNYVSVMDQSVVTLLSYLRKWDDVKWAAVSTVAERRAHVQGEAKGPIQSGTPTHPTDMIGVAMDLAMQESILQQAGLSAKHIAGHGDDVGCHFEGEDTDA